MKAYRITYKNDLAPRFIAAIAAVKEYEEPETLAETSVFVKKFGDPADLSLPDLARSVEEEKARSRKTEVSRTRLHDSGIKKVFKVEEEYTEVVEEPTKRAVELNNCIMSLSPAAKAAYDVYIQAASLPGNRQSVLEKASETFSNIIATERREANLAKERAEKAVNDNFIAQLETLNPDDDMLVLGYLPIPKMPTMGPFEIEQFIHLERSAIQS